MAVKKKKRKRPKNKLASRDYLEPEQVRFCLEILKADAKNGNFRAVVRLFIFQLLLFTGLRREEAATLQMRDLPCRHKKKQIDVRWEVAKSGRSRTIILSDGQTEIINGFIHRFRRETKSTAPLLLNGYGNRMTGQNIYQIIKTIGRRVGILSLHPHTLRHTYLTLLYGVKKDQMFVKDQAGHDKLETTDIYVHIGDIERRRQVSALDWLTT